ncbi:MmpS family transport accessory protein [Rathayibacter sp. CAU 1779]
MSDNQVPPPAAGGFPPAGSPLLPPTGPAAPRRSSGLGVAALVLGIIAFVFAFIPFVNYAAIALAVVGLVLGVIGLVSKGRSKGLPITGTIISGVALLLSIIMVSVYAAAFAAVSKAVEDSAASSITSPSTSASAAPSASASASTDLDVVYSVTSDGATAQTISYFTLNNGQSGQESANGAALPWSKELTLKQTGVFDYSSMTLSAMAGSDATTITCTITVNGVVKSTQTSTGAYALVMCNADGK